MDSLSELVQDDTRIIITRNISQNSFFTRRPFKCYLLLNKLLLVDKLVSIFR